MHIPSIDESRIEQHHDIFYERLIPAEAERVRELVTHVRENSAALYTGPLAVAGVGGVLRRTNPFQATDIDLAIVGMKYTSGPADLRQHSWQDVMEFTTKINDYFNSLGQELARRNGSQRDSYSFKRGSGPLADARINQQVTFHRANEKIGTATSDLESFGPYSSKGFQIAFEGIRPIDMQFVFNMTVEGWMEKQKKLEGAQDKEGRPISPIFYYARL
jgi:hypothetical protein